MCPIYEYECEKCHKSKEVFLLKKDDKSDILCDKCGIIMKKLISKSTFTLKGNCWYKDGYVRGKSK